MNHHHHLRPLSAERGMLLRAGLALVLLAAPVVGTQAQQHDATVRKDFGQGATSLKGLDELEGRNLEYIQSHLLTDAEIADGKYPYDDRGRLFFLYNVKTGQYFNMGSYWGVHASLNDYPVPLFARANSDPEAVRFILEISTSQGNEIKWVNNSGNAADQGVFCDRGKNTDDATLAAEGYPGWFFEKISDGDEKNTYRLYTYTNSNKTGDKMYLSANIEDASTGGTTLVADKYCEAFTQKELQDRGLWDEETQWRVFSLDQIYTVLGWNTDQMTQPLDLSYKLECPGFDRGRTDRKYWHVYTTAAWEEYNPALRIGLEHCNNKQALESSDKVTTLPEFAEDTYNDGEFHTNGTKTFTYTFPYSGSTEMTFNNQDDYLRYMGKYFCAEARATRGYIYEDQYVQHPGTYIISCQGYSNTPQARLFAGIVPEGTGKYEDLTNDATFGNIVEGSLRTTILAQTTNMDATEQARLHIAEKNIDYAGKEFYTSYKYTNSVVVQVTPEMLTGEKKECRIRFGLMIGDPTADDIPSANEWTVFDDFHLYYASNSTKDEDLVLDENRENLNYLRQWTTYQNKTLHLAKTFTEKAWNSFILPVSLSSTQLRTAFGSNVRLAKLKRIEGTEIQFETVDLDQYSTNALEAYVPYIIFPTRVMNEDGTSPYTAYVTKRDAKELDMTDPIVVHKNHFDIAGVTLPINAEGHNDLSRVDDLDRPLPSYQSEDARLEAKGTFVRTFAPNSTQNMDAKSEDYGQWTFSEPIATIRDGYDDLKGCYFFDNGKMYYSDTQVRGLRGFSCWFKPIKTTPEQVKPTVYLDGIDQQGMLTEIGELVLGDEAAVLSARPRGVYNLMGQRLGDTIDGLPAGLYIVDGVKRVVK